MKKTATLFTLFFALSIFPIFGQKSFDFIVGGGAYFTPINYPAIVSGGSFNAEIEYHHTPKLSFSAGFLTAKYSFLNQDTVATFFFEPTKIGSEVQSTIMVKYNLLSFRKSRFNIGAGVGLFLSGREVSVKFYDWGGSISNIYRSESGIGFPLVVEYDRALSRHITLGCRAGTFIYSHYPFVGNNVGLQFKYKLH